MDCLNNHPLLFPGHPIVQLHCREFCVTRCRPASMPITDLRMQNFRSFSDSSSIDFKRGLNVLVSTLSRMSTRLTRSLSKCNPPLPSRLPDPLAEQRLARAGRRQRRGQVQRARRPALCADPGCLSAQPQLGRASEPHPPWTVRGRTAHPATCVGRAHFHRGARQGRRDAAAQAQ